MQRNRLNWQVILLVGLCLGLILALGLMMFVNAGDAPLPPPTVAIHKYGCDIESQVVRLHHKPKDGVETVEEYTEYHLHLWTQKNENGVYEKTWGLFEGVYRDEKTAFDRCRSWRERVKNQLAAEKKQAVPEIVPK